MRVTTVAVVQVRPIGFIPGAQRNGAADFSDWGQHTPGRNAERLGIIARVTEMLCPILAQTPPKLSKELRLRICD